ncbi:MAG: lipocalin family protein [Rhodanobacteraceae bacterium]|nr:lipocalin family protein [Rhodanobacteraceae bacterium]
MNMRLIIVLAALLLAACASRGERGRAPLEAAVDIDLPRFMGTWHVIANVPYFFENGKVATRDEYRLRGDGRIDNDFVFKKRFGEEDRRWRGVSRVIPGSGGARWKVQFVWPFSSELAVVHVDDDYQGAALTTPNRKLAWVFGREPTMDAERYQALVAKLAAQGVDVAALRTVPQVAPSD